MTAQAPEQTEIINEITRRVNDNIRRIRITEEAVRSLERRITTMEQTLIDRNKQLSADIQDSTQSLKETRDKLVNLSIDVQNFKKDLKDFVRKREIRELEEYVSLITPITTKYVTRKEVEEMIKRAEEEESL